MTSGTRIQRFSNPTIALHWLMAILLAAVYLLIELREFYPKGSDPREAMKAWHFMFGMTVFFLVWIRLAVRLRAAKPAIVPTPSAWQNTLASLTHGLLYLLMIGLPLAGWLMLSAAGKPIPFFGLELPPLIGENKALAKAIKEVHETGGTVGYYLIGLHTTAALFHHYLVRDNTLRRMLPFLK